MKMLAVPNAFVFVIDTFAMLLRRGERHFGLLQQLHRLLVHAQHRVLRIVRFLASFEHLFHAGDELGVLLGRNHPVLDSALGHAIYLALRGH
jgi:hypothetical protein